MAELYDDKKSLQKQMEATGHSQAQPPPSYQDAVRNAGDNAKATASEHPVRATSSKAVPGPVLKSYQVDSSSLFTNRHFELSWQGRCVYWSQVRRRLFRSDVVELLYGGESGPIVASAMLGSFDSDIPFITGNPDALDSELWPVARGGTWIEKAWNFNVAGRHYCWRRTHNEELGASMWGSRDFKLLDLTNGEEVVAVFVKSATFGFGARVDFYKWLAREAEAASLVIVMTIEERIRQQHSRSRQSRLLAASTN